MSIKLPLAHVSRPSTLKENAPLLVMLHGYGSDENDLFSFASELPEELFIISIRAPYSLQPSGNAWYAINFDARTNHTHNSIISTNKIMVIQLHYNVFIFFAYFRINSNNMDASYWKTTKSVLNNIGRF